MVRIPLRVVDESVDEIVHEGVVAISVVDTHVHVGAHIGCALAIACAYRVTQRECAVAQGQVGEAVQAAVEGSGAVEGHRVLSSVAAVPHHVDYGALDVSAVETDVERRELLPVGIAEVAAQAVGEIGGQRGITEADVHRVGVVRHGHELRGGRLAGGSAVEQPHAGEFAEVSVERDLGREVPAEVVVGDGAIRSFCLTFGNNVARGAVEGSGGHGREADLCAEAFVLEHHVHAHLLAVGLVDDAVGVLGVEFSVVVEVEGLLVGVGLVPVVGVVGLGVEMVAERLGVGNAAAERVGTLVVGEVLVHRLYGGDSPEVVVGGGSVAVDSVHHVVGEAEVDSGGEGAAGKSEPLPEEEGAAG